MPRSTQSLSRTLSPDDQRSIAAQLHTQRQHEDRLRALARDWPPAQRRGLLWLINRNRTARLEIWYILNPAEDVLWPTSTHRSNTP